jgi:hypothetical protein
VAPHQRDPARPGDRWQLDDQTAAATHAHFSSTAARHAAASARCTIDGCPHAIAGRGLCRKNDNR